MPGEAEGSGDTQTGQCLLLLPGAPVLALQSLLHLDRLPLPTFPGFPGFEARVVKAEKVGAPGAPVGSLLNGE